MAFWWLVVHLARRLGWIALLPRTLIFPLDNILISWLQFIFEKPPHMVWPNQTRGLFRKENILSLDNKWKNISTICSIETWYSARLGSNQYNWICLSWFLPNRIHGQSSNIQCLSLAGEGWMCLIFIFASEARALDHNPFTFVCAINARLLPAISVCK